MKTENQNKYDEYDNSYNHKQRRNKRHKCELKPYKREKYKYNEDVV